MDSHPVRLQNVEFASVVVTPWTEWAFARLRAAGGAFADVEMTADGDVFRLVTEMVGLLEGNLHPWGGGCSASVGCGRATAEG